MTTAKHDDKTAEEVFKAVKDGSMTMEDFVEWSADQTAEAYSAGYDASSSQFD